MIQKELTDSLREVIRRLYDLDTSPSVEFTEPRHGDFTSNVALQIANQLNKSPRDIAKEICQEISSENIDAVTVAGPGFINFKIKPSALSKTINQLDDSFLANNSGNGRKAQVEFLSANPTGPLTIANARGGFIGDVLSNVLQASGYEVTREYYFNNAGTQISKLIESIRAEAGIAELEGGERQYTGEYVAELVEEFQDDLDESDELLKERVTEYIFENLIRPVIKRMGINFDVWTNEKDLIEQGLLDEVINLLREQELIFEKDGALWLASGELGDKREARVLRKSNGDPTYLAPDIAYHYEIFKKRGFDLAIKEFGPDHVAQFPSLVSAVTALIPEADLRLVTHQQFRLISGGEEVKMSKRAGVIVTVDELIEDVGADTARFFMLLHSANTHMDFDLDLAKKQSKENPLYYVMYSYVRAGAILQKAEEQDLAPADKLEQFEDERERQLVLEIMKLPQLVEELATSYEVHKLTHYGHGLARIFHDYYEEVRILGLDTEVAEERLRLIAAYRTVMEQYFALLGITPLKKM